jgi:hypothetical protein
MSPKDYLEIVRLGSKPIPQPFVQGLAGRIIRGKTANDFEKLSDDPNRLVVMLTDSDGLAKMFGKSHYDMLITVGHAPAHIESKLKSGCSYKFVVFPEDQAVVGTWDNLFKIAGEVYPDLMAFCAKYGSELKSLTKFSNGSFMREFENQTPFKWMDVDQQGHTDFMDYQNWNKSQKSLVDLRRLFYHTFHLREFYSGDGFTYDEFGRRGVKEYFLLNKRISDIHGAEVLDLDVKLP